MKIHHDIISIVSACFVLFGCATQQTPAKYKPGAVIDNPKDLPPTQPPDFVSDADRLPQLIRAVNPVYPRDERKKEIQGDAVIMFIVSTDGNVVWTHVVQAPDPVLAQAAVDAVSQWKFIPGEKNGVKVNVRLSETLTFALDK